MYIFGFIVAATLGCTAGSADLGEGMFRHLVVTGRSRPAIYFARIPAGLAIVVPLVAVGFQIVCAVCVFAAPKTLNYQGVNVPAGLAAASSRGRSTMPTRSSVISAMADRDRAARASPVVPMVPCSLRPGQHLRRLPSVSSLRRSRTRPTPATTTSSSIPPTG